MSRNDKTEVNALLYSHIMVIEAMPDIVLQEQEKKYYQYILSLFTTSGKSVEQLRDSQIEIGQALISLQAIASSRLQDIQRMMAPHVAAFTKDAYETWTRKPSKETIESALAADPTVGPYHDAAQKCEQLLKTIDHTFEILKQRHSIVYERSIESRHDMSRSAQ